jgi:predicted RNA-binding Zn-ribbon protein involved in translation (DUF1610 family)
MIRFSCPTCRKALKVPVHEGGGKVTCPKCGQRILVPADARNTTKLAEPSEQPWWTSPPPRQDTGSDIPDALPVLPDEREPYARPEPPVTRKRASNEKYCVDCGGLIRARASICPKCGVPQPDWEGRYEDDDVGYEERPRQNRPFRCPECGSRARPDTRKQIATLGWVFIGVGVLFWPLIILGIFLKDTWQVCSDCGCKVKMLRGTEFST